MLALMTTGKIAPRSAPTGVIPPFLACANPDRCRVSFVSKRHLLLRSMNLKNLNSVLKEHAVLMRIQRDCRAFLEAAVFGA